MRRSDPLLHDRTVRTPVVLVLRLRLGRYLAVRYLDLPLVYLALGVDIITSLGVSPRGFAWRRPHRYYYVASLLKACAFVSKFAAQLQELALTWRSDGSSCG